MQRERRIQKGEEVSKEEILNALTAEAPQRSLQEELKQILTKLVEGNKHIESAIIASTEGLPVAWFSKIQNEMEEKGKIAAAVSVIFLTSERNALDLKKGHINNILVKGSEGYVILQLVGEDHVLASVASEKSRPSVVIRDMTSTRNEAREVLEKF